MLIFLLQYYLTKADVGKNRAQASLEHLRELNSYVSVHAHTESLSEDFLKKFKVIWSNLIYLNAGILFQLYHIVLKIFNERILINIVIIDK